MTGTPLDPEARALLDAADRCLLAHVGAGGPLLEPLAHWHDGRALWMAAAADSPGARRLAADPACAVYVPGEGRAVIAEGGARRFGLDDPLRLALHAGPVSGALFALAFRNASTLLGYAREQALVPARWWPHNRVVVRLAPDAARVVAVPDGATGLPPALPTSVPADVRRAVAGRRSVVLVHGRERPLVIPATWDASFALAGADGAPVAAEGPAAVALHGEEEVGPLGFRGIVVHGEVGDGRLRPQRLTWWRGFDVGTVELDETPARGVVLPD